MRHVRTTLLMASQQLSSAVQWSTAQKAVQRLVPPLSFDSRKGQNGRIGVLGGSYEYTGAPYYAAQSALQAGADLAYVFCADGAAPAIKSYSPELIVLPCYKTANMHDQQATSMAMQEVRPWLARLDCCVIGPGLGRDEGVLKGVADIMKAAEVRSTSTIVDADGLFLVAQDPELVEGRSDCVLTPNRRELERLAARLNVAAEAADVAAQVARKLGNVVVVAKGQRDVITDGTDVLVVDEPGAPKRCGGLGDVLCGALAPLAALAARADAADAAFVGKRPLLWACYGACVASRRAAAAAFARKRRAMTAPDALAEIGGACESVAPTTVVEPPS